MPPAGAILSRIGRFASFGEAQAALAAFPPKAIGRVVSMEGSTVTLELGVGNLPSGDELDVFTSRGHSVGKVKLPPDLGLVVKGDRVKGVTLAGASVEPGALVADRGRFSSLAGVREAVPEEAAARTAEKPAGGLSESVAACAFTPGELTQVLAFKMAARGGTETPGSGGTSYSCTWGEEKGVRSVTLNRMALTGWDPATNCEQHKKMLAGRLEPIAGDGDHAVWQVEQGDLTGVTSHDFRGNTATSLRVSGVDMQNSQVVTATRQALLKLHRL